MTSNPTPSDKQSQADTLCICSLDEGRFASAPDTVNPSLWRISQLLMDAGLYEVVPGVYQVRRADLSNTTIVEGDQGITIYDPLISSETARAALDLYYQNRPRKSVVYSHSHVDHASAA